MLGIFKRLWRWLQPASAQDDFYMALRYLCSDERRYSMGLPPAKIVRRSFRRPTTAPSSSATTVDAYYEVDSKLVYPPPEYRSSAQAFQKWLEETDRRLHPAADPSPPVPTRNTKEGIDNE